MIGKPTRRDGPNFEHFAHSDADDSKGFQLSQCLACSQQLSHLPSAYAAYFYAVHHARFEDRGRKSANMLSTTGQTYSRVGGE